MRKIIWDEVNLLKFKKTILCIIKLQITLAVSFSLFSWVNFRRIVTFLKIFLITLNPTYLEEYL